MNSEKLSTELGTDGALGSGSSSAITSSSIAGSRGHLEGCDTTEWSSARWVGKLNQADVLLITDGTGAGHTSWDGDFDGVVLVDVLGTLDDTQVDEGSHHEGALLGCGDVTPSAWYLSSDLCFSTLRECTGSSWVDDGGVWSSSVSGDDVDGSAEFTSIAANLRKSFTRHGHDTLHVSHGVGTSLGLSETISSGILAVEDSGVDLSLLVGSGTRDDGTLDTKTSGVSTHVTRQDCDLAMGGNEWDDSGDDDSITHICCWGWLVGFLKFIEELKIYKDCIKRDTSQ